MENSQQIADNEGIIQLSDKVSQPEPEFVLIEADPIENQAETQIQEVDKSESEEPSEQQIRPEIQVEIITNTTSNDVDNEVAQSEQKIEETSKLENPEQATDTQTTFTQSEQEQKLQEEEAILRHQAFFSVHEKHIGVSKLPQQNSVSTTEQIQSGADLTQIFNLLSSLKMEIRKRSNIQKRYAQLDQEKDTQTIKEMKKALQQLVNLFEEQERLCPFNPRPVQPPTTHTSNPNNPQQQALPPQTGPKLIVEDVTNAFQNQQRLMNYVLELLLLIREKPALTAELFQFIQEGGFGTKTSGYEQLIAEKPYLKMDTSVIEHLTSLMLDNPFPDTSKTQDTNLLFFNTLRTYHHLMNSPTSANITSKEMIRAHVSSSIFMGLIKSLEAQSYLRFIYRNIFSKINLIQLIAFINEKEALQKQKGGNTTSTNLSQTVLGDSNHHTNPHPSQMMSNQQQRVTPGLSSTTIGMPLGGQGMQKNLSTRDLIEHKTGPAHHKLSYQEEERKTQPLITSNQQQTPILNLPYLQPDKKDDQKKEKQGFFKKLFGGGSKKDKDSKKDKELLAKNEKKMVQQSIKNHHQTYDPHMMAKTHQMFDSQESVPSRATHAPTASQQVNSFVKPAAEGVTTASLQLKSQSESAGYEGYSRATESNNNKSPLTPPDIETTPKVNGTTTTANNKEEMSFFFNDSNTIQEKATTVADDLTSLSSSRRESQTPGLDAVSAATVNDKDSTLFMVDDITKQKMAQAATSDNNFAVANGPPGPVGAAGAVKNKFQYTISQYDLTGYMLHILMKVSEILYLSVCQIPTPIRSFIKILAESIQQRNPKLSKIELYRILNELIVDKWLSVSFQQPEFFGILPKPLHFSEKYKNIFFQTAQKVLQQMFRMEPIEGLSAYQEFFDVERINEYIRHQQENIIMYYEYFLNIDVSVYHTTPQDRGLFEIMALRLDVMKKLLAAVYYEKDRFKMVEPELEDVVDSINTIQRIDNLIDENALNKMNEAAYDLDENHFQQQNPHKEISSDPTHIEVDPSNQVKVLLFYKKKDRSNMKWNQQLNKLLEEETEQFLNSQCIMDRLKFRQLMRNLRELIEQEEVQFPSFYQIVRNKQHEHIGNDLSVILFYLIRGDECNNHTKESDDKDRMRLQCIILYKNLQTTGVMGNNQMQCEILNHLIRRVNIEIQWTIQGYSLLQARNTPDPTLATANLVGFDDLSNTYYCIEKDLQLFFDTIKIERTYCEKIKHAFDLTNFILMVKPFVCLNYDSIEGFTLVRQDKCDKHQANPLLTGQLLFGIVQTNNPGGAGAVGGVQSNASRMNQGRGPNGGQPMTRGGAAQTGRRMENAHTVEPGSIQVKDKLKHYQIKRIDFFIIAFQNKFRSQFRQLIALKTLGQSQKDIDYMNLRTTYNAFQQVIRSLLENDPNLRTKVADSLREINEYIMKQLHRHIFVIIEPSAIDLEIQRTLQRKQYTFESLDIRPELHDEALWLDAICTFDKFSKEETPFDKLNVIARTLKILSHVFNMACCKDGQQATADDEIPMLTYVVSKSISAFRLYSNFQFIKLFNLDLFSGNNLQRSQGVLESVITLILQSDHQPQPFSQLMS